MRTYEYIIIHCSDSSWGSENEIRKWHTDKGWKDTGYHFVINNGKVKSNIYYDFMNGSIELGRPIDQIGAHTKGYNENSIGICLIGINEFTEKQFISLLNLVDQLMDRYNIPVENVLGHYETEQANGKTCPNIDMSDFRSEISKDENDTVNILDNCKLERPN